MKKVELIEEILIVTCNSVKIKKIVIAITQQSLFFSLILYILLIVYDTPLFFLLSFQ